MVEPFKATEETAGDIRDRLGQDGESLAAIAAAIRDVQAARTPLLHADGGALVHVTNPVAGPDVGALATWAKQDIAEGVLESIAMRLLNGTSSAADLLAALVAAAVPTSLPGASGDVTAIDGLYLGFTARETSGSASAMVRLRVADGAGVILDAIELAPQESASAWYGPAGIAADGGIYAEIVDGAVEGSVFHR